jgi:hypothetical protein
MDLDENGLVPRERIEAHRVNCRARIERRRSRGRDTDLLDGALALYEWVLGDASAPISGSAVAPTAAAIGAEERLARSAIYGERGAPEVVSQGWAVGIESTAMWLRDLTDEPADGLLPDEEAELYSDV